MIFLRKNYFMVIFFGFIMIFGLGWSMQVMAVEVEIWDNDTSAWVSDPTQGDPVDSAGTYGAIKPQVAVDSEDRAYVAFYQFDGTAYRVYLNRIDGDNLEAWSGSGWTTDLNLGIPIDKVGLPSGGGDPSREETYGWPIEMAVDSNDVVYVVYRQSESFAAPEQIFLSRYLVKNEEEKVEIWSPIGWNTVLADGRGISDLRLERCDDPKLVVDVNNNIVYITYYGSFTASAAHVYLIRHLVVDDNEQLQTWSESGWSYNLDRPSQIDIGGDNHHCDPQIAVDLQGRVYVASILIKDVSADIHIGRVYLSRYNNVSDQVQIWSPTGWNTTLGTGIPIDMGSEEASGWQGYSAPLWEGGAWNVRIVGGSDFAYASYNQAAEINGETHWHVFLNRASDDGVHIWSDTDTFTGWTQNLVTGTPIDRGTHNDAGHSSIGIDSNNIPYVSFNQYKGEAMAYGIYLVRYNDETVQIWDADAEDWNSELEQGDPIDPLGTESAVLLSALAIDQNDNVYITYVHYLNADIYLNRYTENQIEVWDVDTLDWTSNFTEGDPIHSGLPVDPPFFTNLYGCRPQDLDAKGSLYVTYFQQTADSIQHIYLTRCQPESSSSWLKVTSALYPAMTNKEHTNLEDILYKIRDRILTHSPIGKKLINLTYEQGGKVAEILKNDINLKNKTFSLLSEVSQMAVGYFAGQYRYGDVLLNEEFADRLFKIVSYFEKQGFRDTVLVKEVIKRAQNKTIGELKEIFNLDIVLKSLKK